MNSAVLDLQSYLVNDNANIISALRKAHVIANKLNLDEFDKWISCELSGYSDKNMCPEYRKVKGTIKAWNPYHGWIPVVIVDKEVEDLLTVHAFCDPITEIVSMCNSTNSGVLIFEFVGSIQQYLDKTTNDPLSLPKKLHVSSAYVMDIVDQVKNTLLEWTIKLEKEGVLGEGMVFSNDEIMLAKNNVPQTINNYYRSNIVNGSNDNGYMSTGNVSVNFNYDKCSEVCNEIDNEISNSDLDVDNKDEAKELLKEINSKIKQEKKPSIIKSAFIGLVEFVKDCGANILSEIILAKMAGLF